MRVASALGAFGLIAGLALGAGCSSKSGGTPSGMGGMGGGGGNPLCPVEEDLISAFTIDNGVFPVDGRKGGWYTYGDRSGFGTLMPEEGKGVIPDATMGNPVCSGPGSMHVVSKGFADWGSAMGVDFVPNVLNDAGLNAKGTYDASKYKGIAFWARAAMPIPFVQVSVLDPYTGLPSVAPPEQQCVYNAMMPDKNCSPYLVKLGYGYTGDALTDVMADYPKFIDAKIDETWRRFEILFDDLKQDRTNPGAKSPGDKLDVAHITSMAIQVNTDHSTEPPTPHDWEMWLDDVSFIKK
jgi:hypothetical protein